MADNSYRSSSSRDSLVRDTDLPAYDGASDPLAELARLIGQSDPNAAYARGTAYPAEADDGSTPALDWAALGDGHAEQNHAADARHAAPRFSDSYRSNAPEEAWPHDGDYQDGAGPQYSGPAEAFGDSHPDEHSRDERAPMARNQSFFSAPQRDTHGDADDPRYDEQDQYGSDQYYDEAPPTRRSGAVVIVAVLGLAIVGTAGAFGYRAMFGGSIMPSLPPIIKAADGPNRIVPNQPDSRPNASNQADATNSSSGDRLVPHQEQPVDIPPANTAPRVINTIPVTSSSPNVSGAPVGQPAAPAPVSPSAQPVSPFAGGPPPAANTSPFPPPATTSTEPRRVTTLTVRSRPAPGPAPRPTRSRQPDAQSGPDAPLSIVPGQASPLPAPPPPQVRTAAATPATPSTAPMPLTSASAEPSPSVGVGGYSVQVTSQRSEADARAAYRSLQAKFPQQLRGHQAMVRRADLGPKGVYYRALVGPFASAEQAAGLCSSLKSAGGTCIVQRN
jgi:hypothetical protein